MAIEIEIRAYSYGAVYTTQVASDFYKWLLRNIQKYVDYTVFSVVI